MSNVYPLESARERRNGETGLRLMQAWDPLHVFPATNHLSETSTSSSSNYGSTNQVAQQKLDQQIAQIEALAKQHYPDSQAEQDAYKVQLLLQRLREYHAMFVRL